MVTKKYSNLRKTLYVSLIVLIVLTLSLSVFYITKGHIKNINTWQYNATYDFEQVVETDGQGEISLVCKVSNGEQLAGAFRFASDQMLQDGGGGINTSKPNSSSEIDYSTLPDIEKDAANKIIRLTNTVDLSGKTWKPTELSSGWTFDGAGFIIKNLKISNSGTEVGFISKNEGTIQDIVFENASVVNSDTTAKSTSTGIVVGINKNVIKNIITKGSVKGNAASTSTNNERRVGGIAGYNNSTNALISCCINYANVERSKFSGGIVGNQNNGNIEYCYNYGAISCSYDKWPRLGGIVGEATEGTIQYCYNQGTITDTTSKATGDIRAGGIVGMANTRITLQCCANNSNINIGNSNTVKSYAGGIAGYAKCAITNSFNRGNITVNAKKETSTINSSIKAYSDYMIHQKTHLDFYWGPIVITEELLYERSTPSVYKAYEYAYAGGIAGTGTSATNCYSIGNVEGGYYYNKVTVTENLIARNWGDGLASHIGNTKKTHTFSNYTGLYVANIIPNATITSCYYNGSLTYEKQDGYEHSNGKLIWGGGWVTTKQYEIGKAQQDIKTLYYKNYYTEHFYDIYCNTNPYMTFRLATTGGKYTYSLESFSCHGKDDNENDLKSNNVTATGTLTEIKIGGTSKTTYEIKGLNIGTEWSVDSLKNDGYPYIVKMYW